MNRKQPPGHKKTDTSAGLSAWYQHLMSRRRFLLAAAGGSIGALFPVAIPARSGAGSVVVESTDETAIKNAMRLSNTASGDAATWIVIDSLQQHLFPAELDSPGAREINALGYLRFVVTDTTLDSDEREFILKGVTWLEDMSIQVFKRSFTVLTQDEREQILKQIVKSSAGENWLSTLLLYITEALLSDPVYGGNTNEAGWRWLQHVSGYPRPPADKTFSRLLSGVRS